MNKQNLLISIIIDNPDSWLWNYIDNILCTIKSYSDSTIVYTKVDEINCGDILFILSCDKIIPKEILLRHKNNIVIHESDLPKDRGWSPVAWQVERGFNEIPVTLFEADSVVDNGAWYIKDVIHLNGNELIEEIRYKQIQKTINLINDYLKQWPMNPNQLTGESSYNRRRTSKDQELDITDSITKQFNKLRVCDNERYPAHFFINGHKYILKIYEEKP